MPAKTAKPAKSAASKSGSALEHLLSILDLEPLEENLFRGRSPQQGWQRVFGGQVLGQALVAAVRTVPAERIAHSLHAYFLLPGDPLAADRLQRRARARRRQLHHAPRHRPSSTAGRCSS